MKYDLSSVTGKKEARDYFNRLIEAEVMVEITKKHPTRSLSQNRYLHTLLSYAALEYGETLDYFKEVIWKRIINKDLFETTYTNPNTGETRDAWKSSAELDSKEMSIAIDRLISWSAKNLQVELPSPYELSTLAQMQNEIEKNSKYL